MYGESERRERENAERERERERECREADDYCWLFYLDVDWIC